MKKNSCDINTTLAHQRRGEEKPGRFVTTPIYNASTILFETVEDYEGAFTGKFSGHTYGRNGTPTSESLEIALADIDGADKAFTFSSGIAAIGCALKSQLKAGDHLLITDSVYGPARQFCNQELARFGVEITYYNPMIGEEIQQLIKPNTRVIYMESPGSLTFEVQDITAICNVAKKHNIITMIDNSWATGIFCKPLQHGVDICIQSATKYINGHSDLVMGVVTCNSPHDKAIKQTHYNNGASPSAMDCFLAHRGLRTITLRLERCQKTALELAQWLKSRPEVQKVLHPALPDCPGHENWKKYYTGSSGLFAVLLAGHPKEKVADMLNHTTYFKMGFSWGGFESLMIPFDPKPIRTASSWNHDGLSLRLSIGIEDFNDLKEDLEAAFDRLTKN
jgi:cystathionine beta-lyase